jgi:hypothetical protein
VNRNGLQPRFIVAVSLCVIYALPIFLFGGYYIDDLIRSIQGNTDWIYNGRLFSEYLMKSLYFGNKMVDISPLPQLIAVGLTAITIALLANKYCKSNIYLGVLIFLPLWISPFYLQNISYKYDAGLMAMSTLSAIAPFIFIANGNYKLFVFSSASVFSTLNFYQPAINIFSIFIVIDFLYLANKGNYDNALKRTFIFVAALLVANIVYTLTISRIFVQGDYSLNHSEAATLKDLIPTLLQNVNSFYSLIRMSLPKSFLVVLIPSVLIFLFTLILMLVKKKNGSLLKKSIINIAIASSPIIILFFIIGPMLVLKNPTLAPRTLVGFSALLCSLFFLTSWIPNKYKSLAFLTIILPTVYMFEISFAYYNAMRNQNRYEEIIISNIAYDLKSSDTIDKNQILFNGRVKLSPENRLAVETYPLLDLLIPRNLNFSEFWGAIQLKHYDIHLDYTKPNTLKENELEICNHPIIKKGIYYNIYDSDLGIIFDFNKKTCDNSSNG